MPGLLRRRGVQARTRFLLLNSWVCLVALERRGALRPRRAEPMSNKTNASLVSASLHQGMRMQRPAQGHRSKAG